MKSTEQAIAELTEIRNAVQKIKGVSDMSGLLEVRDGEWFYFTFKDKQFAVDFNYEMNTFAIFSANGTFQVLPDIDLVQHRSVKQTIRRVKSILRIFKTLLED